MKDYSMIFTDIDGTLLNSNHEVPEKTALFLQKLYREENIPVILVSARMPKGMRGIRKRIGVLCPMICYGGAYVLDEKENCLYSQTMEGEYTDSLISIAKKKVSLSLYSYDQWYVLDTKDPWVLQESKITGIIPERLPENTDSQSKIHKILCMGEADVIEQLEKEIKESFPVSVYRSKPTYLEIMSDQVSKAKAVSLLGEYFHVPREKMIAFGDGYNDIEMLQYVHRGIAMGNAADEIKKEADDVTKTNDEEGIWFYLEGRKKGGK